MSEPSPFNKKTDEIFLLQTTKIQMIDDINDKINNFDNVELRDQINIVCEAKTVHENVVDTTLEQRERKLVAVAAVFSGTCVPACSIAARR